MAANRSVSATTLSLFLEKSNIPLSDLEILAHDRDLWCTISAAEVTLSTASDLAADWRRARRHAAASVTPAGPVCPAYHKIYASQFGLRSHL